MSWWRRKAAIKARYAGDGGLVMRRAFTGGG